MPRSKPIACISTLRGRLSTLLAAALAACDDPPEAREQFREQCEQQFACDCITHRFADIDACMLDAEATRAGWLAQFAAAGLTADIACMDSVQAFDPEWCLTWQEYELLHPFEYSDESTKCGQCSMASGDRQFGEPCTSFPAPYDTSISDCAAGLLCLQSRMDNGVCVDPCTPTPAGMPCGDGYTTCAPGLFCDLDRVCAPLAEPGEPCQWRDCVDHHHCADDPRICVPYAGDGEPCLENYCDRELGLVCVPGDVCGPPPKLDEDCLGSCADDLICHPSSHDCRERGQLGAVCKYDTHCAPGLYCSSEETICVPGHGPGEPCDDNNNRCRLGLTCIDGACGPGQGAICGAP